MKELAYGGLHARIAGIIYSRFKPNASILDAGAGEGALTQRLVMSGFKNIWACDICPSNYNYLPVACHYTNLNDFIPYPPNHFDLVVAVEVVEHLLNPFQLFIEARRVLKPGGVLLVTIPDVTNLRSRFKFLLKGNLECYGPVIDPSSLSEHVSIHTKFTLRNLAARAFFQSRREEFDFRGRAFNLNKIFLFKK